MKASSSSAGREGTTVNVPAQEFVVGHLGFSLICKSPPQQYQGVMQMWSDCRRRVRGGVFSAEFMCFTLSLLSSQNPQIPIQDNRILGFRAEGSACVSMGCSVTRVEVVESEPKRWASYRQSWVLHEDRPGAWFTPAPGRLPFCIPGQWELSGTIRKNESIMLTPNKSKQ